MKEDNLVSAIIITHNRKKLVNKAIKSVKKQSYSSIECIVVDDASDDGTKELLEEKAQKEGFRYIYIHKNESKGGNHARNVGILASKGNYIAFLDDDDEWFTEKIALQVEYLNAHPEIGIVHCAKIFEYNYNEKKEQELSSLPEGDFKEKVWSRVPFTTSCILVRREMFDKVGMFDENLRFWQEYELGIRMCQETKIGVVKKHLVLYRVIQNDKNRLTNKISGWEDAVTYIENKHNALLSKLSDEQKVAHKKMIIFDGVLRCNNSNELRTKRLYLKRLFKLEPSVKNFVKLLLNKDKLTFG